MKILFCFTYNKSFLAKFFIELSKMINQSKLEVTIFSLKNTTSQKSIDGIPVIISKKKNYLNNYYSFYKVVKQVKPDIIISNFNYVYPALLIGKYMGVKKNIAWFHTESSHTQPGLFNTLLKKQMIKRADTLIVNSDRLGLDLTKNFNVSKTKIQKVPFWSSISSIETGPSEEKDNSVFKIGCPGRLVKGKNQNILFDSLYELKTKTSKNIKVFIAGNGPEKSFIKEYAKNKKLTDDTCFLGNLTMEEMVIFYKRMDLIILPSLHEAFGLVFLEALSIGVPVLVSNRFGALDFINEEKISSIIFDPENQKDLTEKIMIYINNKGYQSEYFKCLYQENFSPEITWRAIKKILN